MNDATDDDWTRLRVGQVELEVPAGTTSADGHAIEGDVVVLERPGLHLTLDASPFADPLTGYAAKPEHRRWAEPVGGGSRNVVSFRDHDGTTVLATRLPIPLTAVVRLTDDADHDTALRILRSIAPRQGEPDG